MSHQLDISFDGDDGHVTITLVGEIDVSSVPELRDAVDVQIDGGVNDLVLDLSGVVFIDSTGLGALVATHNRCEAEGKRLTLRDPSRQVIKVIKITGLEEILTIQSAD